MSKNALICTGFHATVENAEEKEVFYRQIWRKNVGERDVVVVNNSECANKLAFWDANTRVIEVNANLGHVESFLLMERPIFCGWSMSWIIPALIAYSEGRDFCYQEADCLAFGPWEQSILDDMERGGLLMAFGQGSPLACCEQSLFYIKSEFIRTAVVMYMGILSGDGAMLPEKKFKLMAENDSRIGMFSMGCGRRRPLPLDDKAFYAQKFSVEEIEELKRRNLI